VELSNCIQSKTVLMLAADHQRHSTTVPEVSRLAGVEASMVHEVRGITKNCAVRHSHIEAIRKIIEMREVTLCQHYWKNWL